MSRRAFVVVLDACGVGALPDAAEYGDAGANTLGHLASALGGLDLPCLGELGLGAILPLEGVPAAAPPAAIHGRLHAAGRGKDSTTGHWELMGVVPDAAPPTYPGGFPPEVLETLEQLAGGPLLCNRPYNGITAIDDYGEEHLATGRPILYTSQDSVLQVAAHVSVLPEPDLHALCARIRAALAPPHAVGRVIARPFTGEPGAFLRTRGRRDYALPPPARTHLDELRERGVAVHSVGKVADLFDGHGIDERHPGATNAEALAQVTALMEQLDEGLVFANLIETDQVYGHRKDREGFHDALREADQCIASWRDRMAPGDLLVLTADHGVDMDAAHTDHTREYAFLLATGPGVEPHRHDGPLSDVGATVVRWLTGRDADGLPGSAFVRPD
jgi:phosphopentomutase